MKRLTTKICSLALVFFILFSTIGFFNPVLEVYGDNETTVLPKMPTDAAKWTRTSDSTQSNSQSMTYAALGSAGSNLIENGDFELDPEYYGDWAILADSTRGIPSFIWDNRQYHGTGGHSVNISGTSVTAYCAVEVPVTPNKEYNFKAWGKALNVAVTGDEIGSYIYYAQYDASGNHIAGTTHLVYDYGTFDWSLDESTFVADANASTVFIMLALDGSGEVWYDDISLTEVIPPPPPIVGTFLPAGALITDTVMHPTEPVMYAVDNAKSKLYAINYATKAITEASFNLKPERIEFSNNKLYVTLLKAPHNSYLYDADQRGAIEVINPLNLSVIKRIDVNTDPFDVVVSGDFIYIPSGSGQWTNLMSYSESSKQMISSTMIRQQSYAELNPVLNRIYTIDTDSSPRDYKAFDINNGVIGTSHDSPYHGDYPMNENFRLSPDGKYVFNGSGLVLGCDADAAKDLRFAYKLNDTFKDIAFDIVNNKFYTATNGKLIHSYDYKTYYGANSYNSQGEVEQLYYRSSKLIALSKNDAGQYFVEEINVSDNTGTPSPVVTTKQLTMDGNNYVMNYVVNDSIIHPVDQVLYVTDSTNKKVASINYITGVAKEISNADIPGSIAYYNNELYVGYGSNGKIEIYDAQTLQFKDVIFTGATFFDMTVGRDGFIYTTSRDYTRSFSRATKQEVSKIYVSAQGYLEVHPTLNSLYMTSMFVTPMDHYVVNYNSGNLTKKYDSPYHGDYDLTAKNRISPDGKYIFNGSGNIFACSADSTKDLRFAYSTNAPFSDIAFDTVDNKFYTAVGDKTIYSYDYNNYNKAKTYFTAGDVSHLYFRDSKLIALSKKTAGQYIVEQIDISDNTGIPVQPIAAKQLIREGNKLEMEYIAKDSVMHPNNPVMYIADMQQQKVASINYRTGAVAEISTSYQPQNLAYYNNELFVGYGKNGKIDIYDAQTMQFKDVIFTGATFFDMTVGNDGFIYTTSEDYTRSYSRATKQEASKIYVFELGYLEVHPTLNSLYMTSMYVSPMDLYVMNYNNGSLTEQYGSPYHGDYSLAANNKISPDGKYIFNGSGNIFKTTSDKANNMLFSRKLNVGFKDAEFDLAQNRFYTGVSGNAIYAYDYSTFQGVDTYYTIGNVQKLYRRDNKLIAISQTSDMKNIIEFVTLPVPFDCNDDGKMDIDDLAIISLAYGSDQADGNGRYNAKADFDKNGKVDMLDLVQLAKYYEW